MSLSFVLNKRINIHYLFSIEIKLSKKKRYSIIEVPGQISENCLKIIYMYD